MWWFYWCSSVQFSAPWKNIHVPNPFTKAAQSVPKYIVPVLYCRLQYNYSLLYITTEWMPKIQRKINIHVELRIMCTQQQHCLNWVHDTSSVCSASADDEKKNSKSKIQKLSRFKCNAAPCTDCATSTYLMKRAKK